ncbi:hypothetical protein MVEN_01985900 [Mycena venus]|uniref:Uncharacterized protein n=1 Tax=Mycena venus TaxID=2733690 RepID=A0A8H6XEQ6_9AGAR|nr:hypothetical protein MVEN_01985900 [Mycena venus]
MWSGLGSRVSVCLPLAIWGEFFLLYHPGCVAACSFIRIGSCSRRRPGVSMALARLSNQCAGISANLCPHTRGSSCSRAFRVFSPSQLHPFSLSVNRHASLIISAGTRGKGDKLPWEGQPATDTAHTLRRCLLRAATGGRATGSAERTASGRHVPPPVGTHRGSGFLSWASAIGLVTTTHTGMGYATGGARAAARQMESSVAQGSLALFVFRRWDANAPEGINSISGLERLFKP